ncbi:MAG: ATP-binding protein [Psychrosphaera sp.]|nr:ATP-binding protein [Psychrosphaera sp.]
MTLRQQLLLTANLIALIVSIIILTISYVDGGFSSTFLLFSIIAVVLVAALISQFEQQSRQPMQVIKALAHGDSTLGYSENHPMRQYFECVKSQMQQARFDAQKQSEFLNALLVHIDLGVLVCDEQGNTIESNPALAKLLGKKVTQLSDINPIGELILTNEKNFRGTVQWLNGEKKDTLSLHISIAEIHGKVHKVVTLQSIHEMLQHREQKAYKQLTQVLTHEVANSVAPLASIAHTCVGLLPPQLNFQSEEDKQDLQLALDTMISRADFLSDFIQSFREVSRLPQPELQARDLAPILQRIERLHQQAFNEQAVNFTLAIQCHQLVMLDSGQIEQVLINLVKNALEALNNQHKNQHTTVDTQNQQASITITLGKNNAQQLYVEVLDNGKGIESHVLEMIFIPFFTTKQEGSGIGLSLSKQIIINHGGDLVYLPNGTPNVKGACFRCVFG